MGSNEWIRVERIMKLKSARDVSAILKLLREEHPLKHRRLRVRIVPMKDHGSSQMSGNEKLITIHLREQDSSETKIFFLLHEYAHALEDDERGMHSKRWGQIHSQLYTTWVSTLG